ncbi:Maf family protein [Aerococcaceae bacterium NML190938]|nr:Maf family protein [Aerococcaceae bacterium NML190938]MCW6675159.1 Maf family protein [Aerococcaceae bacterium NML171108]
MKYVVDYQREGIQSEVKQFVLLSGSPRRKELLQFLNPKVVLTDIDERHIEETYMEVYKQDDFVTRVAKTCCEISKAKSQMPLDEQTMYISADTMVVHANRIYNKPLDLADAERMLRSYFGNRHHVVTSVCLRMKDYLDVFYTIAAIEFVDYYPALEVAIQQYLQSGSMLDKSGAYGIQDLDPRFVQSISGDIHTIIGMPVSETARRICVG